MLLFLSSLLEITDPPTSGYVPWLTLSLSLTTTYLSSRFADIYIENIAEINHVLVISVLRIYVSTGRPTKLQEIRIIGDPYSKNTQP